MNTDEMTDVEARALLGRALDSEPVIHLRPESVLGLARRSRSRRRVAALGGLAAAVTALAVGSTALTGTGGGQPTGVDLATAPTLATKIPNPTAGREGPPVLDDRSRRLTEVLANAHVVPPGMRVERYPDLDRDPLVFSTSQDSPLLKDNPLLKEKLSRLMYMASAQLVNAEGAGTVQFVVSRDDSVVRGNPDMGADPLSCAALRGGVSCAERMLAGGIKAVAMTRVGESGTDMRQRSFVYAARANGSYVMVCADSGSEGTIPLAHPPLDLETMFRIAGLPGMEY